MAKLKIVYRDKWGSIDRFETELPGAFPALARRIMRYGIADPRLECPMCGGQEKHDRGCMGAGIPLKAVIITPGAILEIGEL